eukprot:403338008
MNKEDSQQNQNDEGGIKDSKEIIKDSLNDLFKQAIVGRSWKNKDFEVEQLFRSHPKAFSEASQQVMLKILLIPANQQKSADQLILMYLQIYEVLNRCLRLNQGDMLDCLYQMHLETAFKLTQHKQKNIALKAYQWLLQILECSTLPFLIGQKKRIIKSIFTHAINIVETDMFRLESSKLTGIKIAGRILEVVTEKRKSEYIDLITNHFIKIMMEDESQTVRKEVLALLPLTEKTIPYVVMKTQDKSFKVRQQVYISLREKCQVPFQQLRVENRISIIVNGLSDIENNVKEACKEYLTLVICAKKDETPMVVRDPRQGTFQRSKRVFRKDQLIPVLQTIKKLSLSQSQEDTQISLVTYLLMRDIIIPAYGIEKIFDELLDIRERLINDLKRASYQVEQRLDDQLYHELFEEMVFMNFALHVIKRAEFESSSTNFTYQTLQIQMHIPELSIISQLIEHFQERKLNAQQNDQHYVPPTILKQIIYQTFHTINHLIGKLQSSESQAELRSIIVNFLVKKDFFKLQEDDYLNEGDCVQLISDEEQALQEIGVGIKDKMILIQVAMMMLRMIDDQETTKFQQTMQEIIIELRSEATLADHNSKLEQVKNKINSYQNELTKVKDQINNIQSSGVVVEDKLLSKQQKAEEGLGKYTKMKEKLKKRDDQQLKHQLTLIKYFLKTIKIDVETPSIVRQEVKDIFMLSQSHEEEDIRSLGIECLGLLMIHSKNYFEENLSILMDQIQKESELALKTSISHVSIKCIFDGVMVHGYLLESGNNQDIQRQELRKGLMRLLRDSDFTIRLLATEGFCRLLICEKIQNPWDFIARLILLYFERSKQETDGLNKQQALFLVKIRRSIEEFFTHFPRLGYDRCIELFEATLLTIYYLVKSRTQNSSDAQWNNINIYYLFGTLSSMLEYKQNKQFSIFDLQQKGISFQFQFIKFFAYLILQKDCISDQERDQFAKFFILSLQFIDFGEIPHVVPDFEKEFKEFMNPLFNQLSDYFQKLDQNQKVDEYWRKLTIQYIKRKNSDLNNQSAIDNEVKKVMAEAVAQKKEVDFDEDEISIFQHCQAFYNSTIAYQKDFQEQKNVIEEQQDQGQALAMMKRSLGDHTSDMKRAFKDLKKVQTPNLNQLIREPKNEKQSGSSSHTQNMIKTQKASPSQPMYQAINTKPSQAGHDSKQSKKRDKKGKDKESHTQSRKSGVKMEQRGGGGDSSMMSHGGSELQLNSQRSSSKMLVKRQHHDRDPSNSSKHSDSSVQEISFISQNKQVKS